MKMSSSELPALRRARLSLGAILVEAGLLSRADCQRVLLHQAQRAMRFGEAAVDLGLLDEEDLRFALARQFDFPYLRESDGAGRVSADLVTAIDPFGPTAEPLRALRNQLTLRWFDKTAGRNVLAVTGNEPGVGRSYVAANLAVAFAQAGENTLLIDADLRRPRQHTVFGLPGGQGLSSFLVGQTREEPIVGVQSIPGLFVMPAGPVPPNPTELFSRSAWSDLLIQSQAAFDLVLVDTPALAVCEDALLISARVGSALAIARTNVTRAPMFNNLIRACRNAGVDVVGSVLNDLPGKGATP